MPACVVEPALAVFGVGQGEQVRPGRLEADGGLHQLQGLRGPAAALGELAALEQAAGRIDLLQADESGFGLVEMARRQLQVEAGLQRPGIARRHPDRFLDRGEAALEVAGCRRFRDTGGGRPSPPGHRRRRRTGPSVRSSSRRARTSSLAPSWTSRRLQIEKGLVILLLDLQLQPRNAQLAGRRSPAGARRRRRRRTGGGGGEHAAGLRSTAPGRPCRPGGCRLTWQRSPAQSACEATTSPAATARATAAGGPCTALTCVGVQGGQTVEGGDGAQQGGLEVGRDPGLVVRGERAGDLRLEHRDVDGRRRLAGQQEDGDGQDQQDGRAPATAQSPRLRRRRETVRRRRSREAAQSPAACELGQDRRRAAEALPGSLARQRATIRLQDRGHVRHGASRSGRGSS